VIGPKIGPGGAIANSNNQRGFAHLRPDLTEAKALLEELQQDLMANAGDIQSWWAEHGFAKDAEAFVNNAIGLDVLPELTDADPKNIGVAALGDRLDGIPNVISERRRGHAKQVRRSDVPQFQSNVGVRSFG
jgi:hypothetical protein